MVDARTFAATVLRIVRPLKTRVFIMVRMAKLTLVRADKLTQELQVLAHGREVLDKVKHILPYGFTHHPIPGSEAVIAALGGTAANTVALVVGGRMYRLKGMAEGEVAIHDDQGQVVHIERGQIRIESPFNISVTAGNVLRLSGREVHIHAEERLVEGVHGYGRVVEHDHLAKTWREDTYKIPVAPQVVGAGVAYNISEPEII